MGHCPIHSNIDRTVCMGGGDSKNITLANGFSGNARFQILALSIGDNVVKFYKFYWLANGFIVRKNSNAIRENRKCKS